MSVLVGPASIELDTGPTWLVVVVGLGFGVWWFGGYGVCGRWPVNRPEKSTKIGGRRCAPTWALTPWGNAG